MKEVKYNIQTLEDGVEVSAEEGTIEITPEIEGEHGTKLVAHITPEMIVDFVGGRPKNRPSPSA